MKNNLRTSRTSRKNRKQTRQLTSRLGTTAAMALAVGMGSVLTAHAVDGKWNTNNGGSWGDTTLWVANTPANGGGSVADIRFNITATRTITLDGAITVGTLHLGDTNNTNAFVITDGTGGSLTFDNGGAANVQRAPGLAAFNGALLNHQSQYNPSGGFSPNGADRIDATVILNDNLWIDADRNIEFRGAWSTTGGARNITLINSNNLSTAQSNNVRFYWNASGANLGVLSGVGTLDIINGEARFDGVAGTPGSQLIGATTINLGNGTLQTDNRVFPRLFLVNTETTQTANLNINGGWLVSDLGNNDNLDIWSGNITFTGAATTNIFDVNDAGAADTHIVSGTIGGTGGFSKVNAGTLELTANNNISGNIYIQRGGVGGAGLVSEGAVKLSGANGALSSVNSVIVSRDGSLYLDNTATVNSDRFNDAAGLTLRGSGRLRMIGNSAVAASETLGALLQETGSGKVNFDLDDATPQLTTLTFASYTRNAGSITQFQVLDNTPGAFGSPTSGNARLTITTPGASIGGGGTNTNATVINGWSSTNRNIVVGAFGGVNNVSNHFMTYDSLSTSELRPLVWNGNQAQSEYFLSRDGGPGATLPAPHQFTRAGLTSVDQNVNLNFNTAVEGDIGTGLGGGYGWFGSAPIAILENVAMNSLRFGTNTPTVGQNSNEIGSALVLAPGAKLYLGDKAADAFLPAITTSGSGMILFGRDVDGTAPGSNQYIAGGVLDFGSREAIIVNESGNSAFLRSNIVGTGGLTKAGANTVYLDNSNSYSGTTTVAEGILIARDQNALGASPLVVIEGNGQLYLELGTNVINNTAGPTPPSLFVGTTDSSRAALFSNSSNNTWGGDIVIDTVDNLGNWVFTPSIGANVRDTLNINGNIYGNELGAPALGIAANPINTDTVLNDARIIVAAGNASGSIFNLNGQVKDNVNGAIATPVTAANENQLLRFFIQGGNEVVVNARQQWDAAGLVQITQGILRYEGTGNFYTPLAAANVNAANSQSGIRVGGNVNNANAALVLTKPGQTLNIGRIDIGGDGTNNFNSIGNTMLAGTNSTGTVTFGDGTERVVYNGSSSANAFRRDLTAYQIGGGTMELNFRLDDTDADSLTSFTKIGRGVVNYNSAGTVNGDVEMLYMSGGLLRLTNYGVATGTRFDVGAKIVLAGGGIEMDTTSAIANETANYTSAALAGFTGTAEPAETLVSAGGTDVIVTAGAFNATLNIGSATVGLNRQKGGTVNFVENVTGAGAASITLQGNAGQIQANDTAYGWATYGNSYTYNAGTASYTLNAIDFAATTGAGLIGAFAGPTRANTDNVAAWLIGNDVSEDTTGFSGSVAIGVPVNTIHFDVDATNSIDATNGLEVTSGGIMVSSGVLTGAKSINNGTLNAGADTDLIIHHYGGGDMTIGSVIQNNAGSGPGGNALVKTGSGNLILTGMNTYTGGTYLNGGQLTISSNTNLGATPGAPEAANLYGNGGTLRVVSDVDLNVNRGMTLGGNGVEVSVGPASTLTFNGVVTSENTLVLNYVANPAKGRLDKTGLGTLVLTQEDNTYNGLTEVSSGTLKFETATAPANNATMDALGSTFSYLDGTVVRSGATLALHPTTPANNSNRTLFMNEWFSFEGGSTLDVAPVNTTAAPHDFNLVLRGVLNFDSLGNPGTPDGFVTPGTLAGATVVSVARRELRLNDDGGYLTGDGGITKTGAGLLTLRENSPEWTGQLVILEGAVYLYGAGNVAGTGTLPIILGHNLLAEQAGEVVSGNTQVQLLHTDEGGYRDVSRITQDIIVRSDDGAGAQTKRIGARFEANIDEVNYDGNITLRDDLEFFYQDDARNSAGTAATDVTNNTRSVGTLGNQETVFINFNGNIVGAAGNDITTNVVQGGNANVVNGSITAPFDDLVIRAVFGLNGNNSGWAGNLNVGNTAAGGDVDTQHIVTFGNSLAISANNNVTLRSDATLRTNGNNIVIGNLSAANNMSNNFIENSSAAAPGTITITQTSDQVVPVVIRDGETVFILQPGESYQALSLVKAGPAALTLTKGNTFTGTTTLAGGTLRLAYDADNSMLADGAALILNDGILDLAGTVAHSELVLGTTINGTVAITRSAGTSIINLETITRNAGSLRIEADDIATTDNANTNNILGGWATVGTSFATNSGVLGTGSFGNYIRALTTFEQTIDRLAGGAGTQLIANGATDNVTIQEAGNSTNNITMAAAGTTTINTLRQGGDGSNPPTSPAVVDIGGGNTLRIASGGVLLPDGSSSLTFNPTGTLTAGATDNTAATLFLQSQDTDTNPLTAQLLTVGAVIADNGTGMVDVRTTGPGTTVFTGTNTFTGETLVGSGTLSIGDGGVAGTLGSGKAKVEASAILAFNRSDAALSVSGEVYGSGTVAQFGTGTTTLNGATTGTNSLTFVLVDGTLATGVDGAINTTGNLVFGGSSGATVIGTLNLGGNATVGGLQVQTNSATANGLAISSGKTLTVNGAVTIGADVAASQTALTATGGGNLVVNSSGANFQVGGATGATNSNAVTADFSGLENFTVNLGAGIFRIGDANTGTVADPSTVKLASSSATSSNSITAGSILVGDGSGPGSVHTLTLGQGTNTLNTDILNVGSAVNRIRSSGQIVFDGADTTGTLKVRASDGTGRALINMVNTTGSTANSMTSTIDLTGHSADILASTVTMANRTANTGNATATLSFDGGTLDVLVLNIANRGGGGSGNSTATVNLGAGAAAGTSTIGYVEMGVNTSTNAGSAVTADLNVTGGSVTVGTGSGTAINMANAGTGRTVNSTIDLTGGTTTLTGNIVRTGGAGTENATVTIGGGALNMSGNSIGTATETISLVAQSGSLSNLAELNGGGTLTKTTGGTLDAAGSNTYTGATVVDAGTLNVTGSISGTSAVTVNNTGTLLLSSNEGVNNAANVTLNGGTLAFGSGSNQVETLGTLTLSASSVLDFGASGGNDSLYFAAVPVSGGFNLTIDNWVGSLTGGVDGVNDRLVFNGAVSDFTSAFMQSQVTFSGFGTGYTAIDFGGAAYEIVPVPEPASTALVGSLALGALIGYRERRRFTRKPGARKEKA